MDDLTKKYFDDRVADAIQKIKNWQEGLIAHGLRESEEAIRNLQDMVGLLKDVPDSFSGLVDISKGMLRISRFKNRQGHVLDNFHVQIGHEQVLHSYREGIKIEPGQSIMVLVAFVPIEEEKVDADQD